MAILFESFIVISFIMTASPMILEGQFSLCSVTNSFYWDQDSNCNSLSTHEPYDAFYQLYYKKPDIYGETYECLIKKIIHLSSETLFLNRNYIEIEYMNLSRHECQSLIQSQTCKGIFLEDNYVIVIDSF